MATASGYINARNCCYRNRGQGLAVYVFDFQAGNITGQCGQGTSPDGNGSQ